MTLDLAALDPAPTKVVANLPYGIAAERDPADDRGAAGRATRWVAMVQREVGERLAAAPGDAAYGVPSVLAQLACEVRVLRPISRTVFFPVPNVDSVLVGLERTGPGRARRAARARAGRHSPTGARRSRARWRSRAGGSRRARPRARGAGGAWASPPTCAPSASRPRGLPRAARAARP